MQTAKTITGVRARVTEWRQAGCRIGFVPTMGCLHEGHLSLMREARARCDKVVVSIFVNPIQFGPGEDFSTYPRVLDADADACRREGVDLIFCPDVDELYGKGQTVFVDETQLSLGLCGARRPGHFRGVTTVVAKLFNIVQADVAVFGQKDAQQVRVIQQMVAELNMPVDVVIAPTVREADGLAMSSRNRYLSDSERKDALCVSQALAAAERLYQAGERNAAALRAEMLACINPVASATVDYIAIVDWRSLQPVAVLGTETLLALAVQVGPARLIDNAILPAPARLSGPTARATEG